MFTRRAVPLNKYVVKKVATLAGRKKFNKIVLCFEIGFGSEIYLIPDNKIQCTHSLPD